MAICGLEQESRQHELDSYISSNEGFKFHVRHLTIVNPSVHLENDQLVYFTEDNAQKVLLDVQKTTLTPSL